MLFNLYVFALVLGGILLAASMFLGGEEGGDAHGDLGADVDADADLHAGGHAGHGHHGFDNTLDTHGSTLGFFATVLSLRFWTFFLAFFGGTGLLFDGLDLAPTLVIPAIATGMGLVTGYATVAVIRSLSREGGGKVATASDYIGQSGRVLLPIKPGVLGKIRLELAGTTVDVLASSSDENPFEVGDSALVIEMEGTTALVSRSKT